jgi:hypothetical protein
MLVQVKYFLGKNTFLKLADLHPRRGTLNSLQMKNYSGVIEPLFASQNRVEISRKKILPFFKHASSSVALRFL